MKLPDCMGDISFYLSQLDSCESNGRGMGWDATDVSGTLKASRLTVHCPPAAAS